MRLREDYQALLTQNPNPNWLKDRQGNQYRLLRLFAEACWAKVGFHSQKQLHYSKVSWGTTIVGRPQLFDYYLELRQESLRQAFFTLTDAQLDELAALDLPADGTRAIRDDFLFYCRRKNETTDQYGQHLPDRVYPILLAIEEAPPFRHQGACSLTKKVSIKGKPYFAKMNDEVISDSIPPGEEEYHEVTSHRALVALHPAIVPAESFHIIAADGQQCLLTSAVTNGYTYAPENHAKAAPFVEIECLQWIVLAEWLFGLVDRHAGNLIIQKAKRQAVIIDNAFSWRFHPKFLGWNEDEGFFNSFARGMWEVQDASLTFRRSILEGQ